LEAKDYSAIETLRDGRRTIIRALRPEDRSGLISAMSRTGEQSRYRRFFAFKPGFTEQEIAFYVNVDQLNHVALVALMEEGGQPIIVGGDVMSCRSPAWPSWPSRWTTATRGKGSARR
jgi:hypothetical protein